MKIYCCHSKKIDYQNLFYKPIEESLLAQEHEFIFPHKTEETVKSKEIIQKSDAVIAEVSECATGMGIELGWADMFQRPIHCFYKENSQPSGSLQYICSSMNSYRDTQDFIEKIASALKNSP